MQKDDVLYCGEREMVIDMEGSTMQYNVGTLPVRAGIFGNRKLPATESIRHFHEEYEIIIMRMGEMMYEVEGQSFSLKEGQVLFVNAGRMHRLIYGEENEASYVYLGVHPQLLFANSFFAEYEEKMKAGSMGDFLLLSPTSPRQMKLTEKAENAFQHILRKKEGYALGFVGSIYELFGALYEYMMESQTEIEEDPKEKSLHAMVGYIQTHYAEKITLEILAAAGETCRSRCCEYFKEYFQVSPNVYITEVRLAKAMDMLLTTDLDAKEIGKRCGFAGGSYFTETFRKYKNMTPLAFRKQGTKK